MPVAASWHLITGEYPPEHGGVSDYTQQVALGLRAEGCQVHVWCRGDEQTGIEDRPGLSIHRVAGNFDRVGLSRLSRAIDAIPGPRIVLVQYVPHAFGKRGMNIPFCYWVSDRSRRGDDARVMFHEVRMPFVIRPLKWNIIALAQRMMAKILVRAAVKIYVSTAAWIPILSKLGLGKRQIEPIAIPSNIPRAVAADRVAAARRELSPDDALVVGHFGTYGPTITKLLTPLVDRLTREHSTLRIALLGRGSANYRRQLIESRPNLATRISAFDDISPDDVTAHIKAADVMLQPFIDGASFRRTSLMACLAAAAPTVTTHGELSEPIWQTQAICAATPVGDVEAVADVVRRLFGDHDARRALGRKAAAYYDRHFSLERTIETLLGRTPRTVSSPSEPNAVVER